MGHEMIEMDGPVIPDPQPSSQTWRRRLLAVGTLAALATGIAGFAVGRATGPNASDADAGAASTPTE